MKPDKLVIGLGNPGDNYKGTRHNIGFMVLAELARRHSAGQMRRQFHANTVEAVIKGTNILMLCPTTFMNLSGTAVAEVVKFYKLDPSKLLLVCDDLDLPVGKIRMRASGGSGGQKGLKDTIAKIGTEQFARLRVGIGRPPEKWDTADYVLSKFTQSEKVDIDLALQNAADAVEVWIADSIEAAMNRFNS